MRSSGSRGMLQIGDGPASRWYTELDLGGMTRTVLSSERGGRSMIDHFQHNDKNDNLFSYTPYVRKLDCLELPCDAEVGTQSVAQS